MIFFWCGQYFYILERNNLYCQYGFKSFAGIFHCSYEKKYPRRLSIYRNYVFKVRHLFRLLDAYLNLLYVDINYINLLLYSVIFRKLCMWKIIYYNKLTIWQNFNYNIIFIYLRTIYILHICTYNAICYHILQSE